MSRQLSPTQITESKAKAAVFTISATNYVGLAEVMLLSAKSHHPDLELHLFITDSDVVAFNKLETISYHCAPVELSAYYIEQAYSDLAFAYNITELATSIKAACFLFLFDNTLCHRVVYLDPDIYLYSNIDPILQLLDSYSVTLTPHILSSSLSSKCPLHETFINTTGIFNLGFIGISKTSAANDILQWWHQRLQKYSLSETIDGQYTDQIWINFLISYWDSKEIAILRDPGCNLAPWNYHERVVVELDTGLNVLLADPTLFSINDSIYKGNSNKSNPLIFAHFSGFNYTSLIEGQIVQKNIHPELFADSSVYLIYSRYINALQSNKLRIKSFLDMPYAYASLINGSTITNFQRRLFYAIFINPINRHPSLKLSPREFQYALKKKNRLLRLISSLFLGNKQLSCGQDRNLPRIPRIVGILFRLLYFLLRDKAFYAFLNGLRYMSRPKRYTYFID